MYGRLFKGIEAVKHRTFLNHFIFSLAILTLLFLAGRAGVLTTVWHTDASHMTSLIGAGLLMSMIEIGRAAWRLNDFEEMGYSRRQVVVGSLYPHDVYAYGHLTERLLPMIGLFGTAFGLSLQAAALSAGGASFEALATSLYCTATGVLAAALVAIMTFNLEAGIKRARR